MKQTTTLLLTCALLSVTSCKKDKKTTTPDPEPVVNCDLASEMIDGTDTTTYEYDNENRLVRQDLNGDLELTIQYLDANTIKETSSSAIYTYTLNGQGRTTMILAEGNSGNRSKTYYTYDNYGFVTKVLSHTLNAQDSILEKDSINITNTVANQNLITQVIDGVFNIEISATHDLNRPNNIPVPRPYTSSFFTGNQVDKNLVMTASVINTGNNETQSVNYSYLFDGKGRITRRTSINYSPGPTTYDTTYYKYRCD